MATLILLNKELGDIMKIVIYLEKLGLLIKGISETLQNETKEQNREFLDMSLGTLASSLLRNNLAGKGVFRGGDEVIRASEGQNFWWCLIL